MDRKAKPAVAAIVAAFTFALGGGPDGGGGVQACADEAMPSGAQDELREAWPQRVTLHVLDAQTQEELKEVVVVTAPEHESGSALVLHAESRIVAAGNSPLTLPEETGEVRYYVVARGHAFKEIHVKHTDPRARHLVLRAGGDLEIALRRLPLDPPCQLRLYEKKPSPWLESEALEGLRRLRPRGMPLLTAAPRESLTMRGLEPGSYDLCLEQGWGRVLAVAQVVIRPGETTRVELTATPVSPSGAKVPLRGTISIPPAWNVKGFELQVHALGSPEFRWENGTRVISSREMHCQTGLFTWDAGQVAEGPCVLTIERPPFSHVADVGPGGATLGLRLPDPAEVRVRFRDSRTGAPATTSYVEWYALYPGVGFFTDDHVGPGPVTGEYSFQAPIGRAHITVPLMDQPYRCFAETVDIHAGLNEFTFDLDPTIGIRLTLLEGGCAVPLDDSFRTSIRRLDGPGHVVEVVQGLGIPWQATYSRTYYLSDPGRYEVTFDELPGLSPVAPIETDVEKGKLSVLRVEL
ncbi:MAG: hypothetical protein AB1486_16220 [Planctomycetota bacterium]